MTDPVRPVAPREDELIALVEEFVGWWDRHREGSTNAAYLRVDRFEKDAREALEHLAAAPVPCVPADPWQPIETAPRNAEVFFWIVPKTPDEAYVDTSGKPIVGDFQPFLHRGKFKSWSGLSKATHWLPLPTPPRATGEGARDETSTPSVAEPVVAGGRAAADGGSDDVPGNHRPSAGQVAVSLDPHRLRDRVKLMVERFRALGGIPELCDHAWELCCENERLHTELARLRGEATVRQDEK